MQITIGGRRIRCDSAFGARRAAACGRHLAAAHYILTKACAAASAEVVDLAGSVCAPLPADIENLPAAGRDDDPIAAGHQRSEESASA